MCYRNSHTPRTKLEVPVKFSHLHPIHTTGLFALCSLLFISCHDYPCDGETQKTYEGCSQILLNPSFESIEGDALSRISWVSGATLRVPGWSSAPDLDPAHMFMWRDGDRFMDFMGPSSPFDGSNYAGISSGNNRFGYLTQSLMGTLHPAAPEGVERTYNVSAWFRSGNERPNPADIGMFLYNSQTDEELAVVDVRIPYSESWQQYSGSITTEKAFDRLIIRGIKKAPNSHTLSFKFVDNVSVEECIGECKDCDDNELR